MSRVHKGFTIVELIIVIVIIAILAIITATIYQSVQVQARDAQMSDAATKVADAIQLFASKNGHFPAGGWGSSTAIGAGTECSNGVNGWFASGLYTCTVEDTLKASGYLPAGFAANLPANTKYTSPNTLALMVYIYSGNLAMVYYSMESPSTSDTNHFNAQLTKCGINPAGTVTQRDTYGMRNGICFSYAN